MPSGLTRCEAEYLSAVGMYPLVHLYNTYICIYTANPKVNTYTVCAQTNKNISNILILFPSLTGQDQNEDPLVENVYADRYIVWIPPVLGLRLSVKPVAATGSLVSPAAGTWACNPPKIQAHSHCQCRTTLHTHGNVHTHGNTHTQIHMLRIPPATGLRHPVYPVDGSQVPRLQLHATWWNTNANGFLSQPPDPTVSPAAGLDPLVLPMVNSQTSAVYLASQDICPTLCQVCLGLC